MSATKQIVAVVGATGAQGGGVVDALVKHGRFAVRALSRSTSSPSAQRLAGKAVDVVKADLGDKQSLVKAFQGAYGVFVVTLASHSHAVEIQHGINAVDAAKEVGVKHVIWSTLEDPSEVVPKGAFREPAPGLIVPHFQSKAAVGEYLRKSGVPYTMVLTSFFFENFTTIPYFKYLDGSFGSFAFGNMRPDVPLPAHAVGDIGETVAACFDDPKRYAGKTVPVTPEYIKLTDAMQLISQGSGKRFKFVPVTDTQYWYLPFPGGIAKDMSNMFRYYREYPSHVAKLREASNAPFKGPSLREWAEANKSKLASPPSAGVFGTWFLSAWLWVTSLIAR